MSRSFQSWRPFEEARTFVHSLGLKNKKEWEQWMKMGERPSDIPAAPERIYKKEFLGYGDWLGTGAPRKRKPARTQTYLSFEEARAYVHSFGFARFEDYRAWSKSDARPDNIPGDPYHHYKDKGWRGVGDWLGSDQRQRIFDVDGTAFRPFEEAREFARKLRLQGQAEWLAATQAPDWPKDIPVKPEVRYRDQGWAGWGDFLGNYRSWDRDTIRAFLVSLQPLLPELQPAELYSILQTRGLIRMDSRNPNWHLIRHLEHLCSRQQPASLASLAKLVGFDLPPEPIPNGGRRNAQGAVSDPKQPTTSNTFSAVHAVDKLVETGVLREEDVLEFIVDNRVNDLWQSLFEIGETEIVTKLLDENGGDYFHRVRDKFLIQYREASSLPIPTGYEFRVDGNPTPPNLMQRLTALRLRNDRRIGNLSGVGAGKTGAAILGSRVINARLSVIIAFNSNVDGWSRAIREFFPDSVVLTKEREVADVDPTKHTYLVVNYESFQQHWSQAFVRQLTQQHKIDLIVLDEIQSVRQRHASNVSTRRENVTDLVAMALGANPELRVLGMSATPVINELHEGKALLETITGQTLDHLALRPTIRNAIAMHTQFRVHGLRFRPNYSQALDFSFLRIDGHAILPQLRRAQRRSILQLEQIVLDAKLPTIATRIRPGTLIYTHFVDGIVDRLDACIRNASLQPGHFTGEDKTGLDAFLSQEVDVLIGSGPIGTGIDGLQRVCNRLIFACLPWTSAEFEQIIGRLHRQGSTFDKVEVIVPQVSLTHGTNTWSWDTHRMDIIQHKKTMADAVLDGVIPEGKLPTRHELHQESLRALKRWIASTQMEPTADQAILESVVA